MSSNNQTISPDLIRDETLSHPPHEEPIQSFLNQFRRNSEHNSTNGSGTIPSKTLPPQSNNLLSLFSMASFAGPNTNQQAPSNLQTQPSLPKAAPGFNADKDASQNLLSLLTKNVISPSFPTESPNLAPTNDSPKLQLQDGQNGVSRNSIKSPEKLLEESSQALRNLIVGQAPKSENDLNHYYPPASVPAANGIQDGPFGAFVKGFTKEKKQDSDNSFSASELASVSPQNIPLPATPQSEKSSRAISPKTFFSQALSPNQQEKTTSTQSTYNTDLKSMLNNDSKGKDIGASPFDNSNLFDLLENSTETSPPKVIPASSSQRNIEISDQAGLESIPSAVDYLDNFTISQVTSEAELNSGQLVSSHCGLISYVMKSGKVRLIYEKDGYRTLLRDDKSQIIDMKLRKHFSQEDIENGQNHRLVTLSQSNNFIIWDIKRNSASDRGLEYSMVCKINGTPDDIEFSRVIFHPTNPSIIAVSCSNNEILIFNTDIIPACVNSTFNPSQLANVTTVLSGLDDALTSICFSPDGSCVFAGTQSGVVGVWNWSNSPHPLMKIQTNAHLPIHYIQPCQPKSSKNQTTLLPASFVILGFNHNLHIQLWDMTSQQSIHTIQFKLSTPITKKSVNTLKYDPASETLFVGCSSRSSIILFNLNWMYDNFPLSRFNNSVEYSCPDYILSMDISSSANPIDSNSIVLYLMHAKTIQMYTIPGEQLLAGFDRSTLQPRVTSTTTANANTKPKQIIIAQPDKPVQQILKDSTKTKTAQKAKKNSEPKANSTQPSLSLLSMGDFKPVDAILEKPKVQAKEPQSKSIISIEKIEKSKTAPSSATDSQKADQLTKTLTKSIDSINQNINYTLSTVVPASIQRGVSESIHLSLEQQVPTLMDQYFTGPDFQKYLDSMIQHHVNVALQSEALVESITGTITSNVIGGIQEAFQNSFTTLLIPAYQKATQKMFTQMQSAFESGLNKNFEELQKLPSLYPGASMISPSHIDPRQQPFPYPHHPPPPPPHAIPPHYPAPQHPQHPLQMIPQPIPQNPTQNIPKEEDNAITRFLKMNNNGAPPPNTFSGPAQPLPFPSVNVKQPSPPITQPTTPPTQQSTTLDPSVKDNIMQAVSVKDVSSILKLIGNQNIPLVFYTCQFKQRDILGLAKILAKDLNQQTGIRLQILQEAIRNIDCKDNSIISHLDHFLEFIYNQCNSFEKANPSASAQWSQLPLIKSLILDIKKQ